MKSSYYPLIMLLVALLVGAGVWALHTADPAYSLPAMLGADAIMLALTVVSWLLIRGQLGGGGSPQAFVRAVSSASLLKLMICGGSILGYALAIRPHKHVPTLLVLCGIYLVFTVVETALLSRMARLKKQ